MVRYLFYTIGDLTYQSPLVVRHRQFSQKLTTLMIRNWRDSSIKTKWDYSVQWLVYGLEDSVFESRQRREIFLFSKTSTQVLWPTQSPTQWTPWGLSRGSDGRGVKLTTQFHVVPRFGIRGAIPLLLYMPSGNTKGQLYLSWLRACLTSGLCLIVFTGDRSSLTWL